MTTQAALLLDHRSSASKDCSGHPTAMLKILIGSIYDRLNMLFSQIPMYKLNFSLIIYFDLTYNLAQFLIQSGAPCAGLPADAGAGETQPARHLDRC